MTDPVNNKAHNSILDENYLTEELFNVIYNKTPLVDQEKSQLREQAVAHGEAQKSPHGPLLYYSAEDCKGRSPLSTFIVDDNEGIDWGRMIGFPREAFEALWGFAVQKLSMADRVYVNHRSIGADPLYTMPVTVITNTAVTSLFIRTMLRPEADYTYSHLKTPEMIVLSLPWERIDVSMLDEKHIRALSYHQDGQTLTQNKAIVMDMKHNIALILGDSYNGSQKKTIYTMYNYALAQKKVLPMHCSANIGREKKDTALFFGLSGTGKTTLSTDSKRLMVGDDEHGWSDDGIYNFENGCYAKTFGITLETEPEIFNAAHTTRSILENVSVSDNGTIQFFDESHHKTANGRVAYPLKVLHQVAPQLVRPPKNIFILSFDAFGVLPPIARLNRKQAMLFYLLGFSSKVSGTEAHISTPEVTFSPCLGGPFFPHEPLVYAKMFGERLNMDEDINVWFINTGRNGKGERMSLSMTRTLIHAALNGSLNNVAYSKDPVFGFAVPHECEGITSTHLQAKNYWDDEQEYSVKAQHLAGLFKEKLLEHSKETIEAFKDICPGF